MSHQVGLVWQGGNGWDDLMREQVVFLLNVPNCFDIESFILIILIKAEESTIRQRLGGRRDSAAQISAASPPCSPPQSKILLKINSYILNRSMI